MLRMAAAVAAAAVRPSQAKKARASVNTTGLLIHSTVYISCLIPPCYYMAQVQKGVCILVVYCGCSHLSIGYQPYRQIRAVPVAFPEAMADPSSSSHLHAAASASGGDPRRTQSGAVSDRSRSERGADPDGLATSEHSYAPTSIIQSDAANMDLLMIEPPATSTDLVCLGEPKANETSPPTVPMQAGRLGEPSVTLNAEQKNLLVNAYDQRQVHLHQQAVYVSQDKGPIVASEAREAISELETQAQQRHERAMRDSKREMEDMAQQRLRMAESAIAEQAEEAFKNRVGTITQLQHAEIQEVNKLRTELQSAQVLREEMQLEGAKKMSLYDSRLDEMRHLVNELKATNDRQRQEYESQLHRCHSIIAAHQPPIRIPDDEPVHKADTWKIHR